jgi:acetolactate synthase I/II/III large subunit
VIMADASRELQKLAERGNMPVTATIHGLGCMPANHELFLGMVGMHGTWTANTAISECDVLIAIGARFDDRVTGRVNSFSTKSKKIHIDIDPSCISKIIKVNVPIVGNAKDIIPEMTKLIESKQRKPWINSIKEWKKEHPLQYKVSDGFVSPQYVIEKINDLTGGDCIVAVDVGQNQMWTAQYFGFNHPRSFLNSGGLGTMGYSLPAAIGASFGAKGKTVFAICGDGGFQMNMQELATAARYNVPVKIVILNNEYLGMVRQWQQLFRGARYSHTWIKQGTPDFAKLANSFGIEAYKVTKQEEVEPYLKKAMKVNDKPFLLEFKVPPEENVYPMVPAGASLSEMITGSEK